jgi:hypothetical protein
MQPGSDCVDKPSEMAEQLLQVCGASSQSVPSQRALVRHACALVKSRARTDMHQAFVLDLLAHVVTWTRSLRPWR